MYESCIYCNACLGTNRVLDHFPVGDRIVYDPTDGRLWVICRRCKHWNLAPIEERWEAIEESEFQFHGRPAVALTDGIAEVRVSRSLRLLRIGKTSRSDVLLWRYGPEFRRRQRRSDAIALGLSLIGISLLVAFADAIFPTLWQFITSYSEALGTVILAPALAFIAVREHLRDRSNIAAIVVGPGESATQLNGRHAREATVVLAGDAEPFMLRIPHDGGAITLRGRKAYRVAAAVLAHLNDAGASKRVLKVAVETLDEPGKESAEGVLNWIFERSRADSEQSAAAAAREVFASARVIRLAALPSLDRLCLEIAVTHELEAEGASSGEKRIVPPLEASWREASDIAAIADDLLPNTLVEERLAQLRQANKRGGTES